MHPETRLLLVAALLVGIIGCNPGKDIPPGGTTKSRQPVFALVAASTKDAVQEIATAFTNDTNIDVRIDADDSSKLATQIVHGAPAHLFLSANEKWADFVRDKGFAEEATLLLGNSLVIVVPKGNPAGIKRAEDLNKPSLHRIALAGPSVPAGIYARQALTTLKLLDQLEKHKKVVSGENVRVTLTYVERGEVEAGIVYATDAKITDKVETVYSFDKGSHDPIRYPLVLLTAGKGSPASRSFFEFLQTAKAKGIFTKYGFVVLDAK